MTRRPNVNLGSNVDAIHRKVYLKGRIHGHQFVTTTFSNGWVASTGMCIHCDISETSYEYFVNLRHPDSVSYTPLPACPYSEV